MTEVQKEVQSDDLFIHHEFTVDAGQEPLRIDRYLVNKLQHISRTRIQTAAKAEAIQVNDKPVKSNYKVQPDDHIAIVLDHPPEHHEVKPENIPLDIAFEDDHLIIVNKPAGLVVHPGVGNWTGTLVNGLMHHLGQLPKHGEIDVRPGLVHRLDKDTSGLMVIAKSDYALSHLARQFFDRTINRSYVALVWGDLEQDAGDVTGNIGRHKRHRQLMDVFPEGDYGKPAETHYNVIERFHYVTLVECRLKTGRTHQIRVHMKHIGHPVFNDHIYGGNRIVSGTVHKRYKQFVENCFNLLPRQALHAKTLGFVHPDSGDELSFDSEVSQDIALVVEEWSKYLA